MRDTDRRRDASRTCPYLARDVYDFGALHEVGQVLFGRTDRRRASLTAMSTTILVAADAQWVRDQVRAAFVGPGQRVVEVTRGQDVRDAVAEEEPDLVDPRPADRQHGRRRGRDRPAARGVGRPARPRATILLLLDREADEFLARRADVDLMLVKPVDAGVLRRAATPAARTAPS